ncbi:MAG: polyhydroxyalkanoate depolymerase, partial [Pseudomonadota bacterium]
MLYQFYETQRALLSPFAEFASATAKLYSHPLSPFAQSPGAERMAAGFDLLHRLTKEYEKPGFEITSVKVDGIDVAVQEQVVEARPFCRLLRFKRYTDNAQMLERMRAQPVVLVVAPLSGHHSTLLRDTVRTLLQDHEVYITDWVNAREVPLLEGRFDFHDYIDHVRTMITRVGPGSHVVGVCQPGPPVLAACALMAEDKDPNRPASMTFMGSPIDARLSPTVTNQLAEE